MQIADVHATVYSTCAIEATRFDVLNILIDLNGMSTQYFNKILQEKEDAYYINTADEMIQCIKKQTDTTKKMNTYFFNLKYDENLRENLHVIEAQQ